MTFGIEAPVSTQRLIADSGVDQQTMTLGDTIDPAQLATVFNDPRFEDRRYDVQDIYVRYVGRQHREGPQPQAPSGPRRRRCRGLTCKTIAGGNFAGDLADGLIKPNIAADYQPSGMWTDMFGQAIPDNGDPEFAKKLIAESGEPMPKITYDYGKTPAHATRPPAPSSRPWRRRASRSLPTRSIRVPTTASSSTMRRPTS